MSENLSGEDFEVVEVDLSAQSDPMVRKIGILKGAGALIAVTAMGFGILELNENDKERRAEKAAEEKTEDAALDSEARISLMGILEASNVTTVAPSETVEDSPGNPEHFVEIRKTLDYSRRANTWFAGSGPQFMKNEGFLGKWLDAENCAQAKLSQNETTGLAPAIKVIHTSEGGVDIEFGARVVEICNTNPLDGTYVLIEGVEELVSGNFGYKYPINPSS